MEVAAAVPAVSAETRPAAAALPSPQKQSASQASQASQPSKQAAVAAVKAHRACCPACGAPPLTEEELATVRKPGRRSTRDANDPRNRPENLVKTEFLQQHIVKGGMSLREISAYHGYTISTLSRRAKQLGVQVGRVPRVASDSEQASEGAAVRSPAPTPPRKRPPPLDKQQGREEQLGSPAKRRKARQPDQQPAKSSGAAATAPAAAAAPKPAAAAPASSVSAGPAAAAAEASSVGPGAVPPAAGNAAGAPGPAEEQAAAKRRRRPGQPAEKQEQPSPQRSVARIALAPGMAAATAAAAAMGPLLALSAKPVDLPKSNLGPAAGAAAPAHLVWHPPSKAQMEIWQAVQAQTKALQELHERVQAAAPQAQASRAHAAAAEAEAVRVRRPTNTLPLLHPVGLPGGAGLQHSPLKPPRPTSSQQKASPVPPRRRAARQPQPQAGPQLSLLEDSDDEDAIAGLVSLRLQSTEPSTGPPQVPAVTTAAGPAAPAPAHPAASTGAARGDPEPVVGVEAAAAASVLAGGAGKVPASQGASGAVPAAQPAPSAVPAAQAAGDAALTGAEDASQAAAPAGPAAGPTAATAGAAAAGTVSAAAEAAAAPAAGLTAQVEVKHEPQEFAAEQQQGAAALVAAEQKIQQWQDSQGVKGVPAKQQEPTPAPMLAQQQGAVQVKDEGPMDRRKDEGLAASNGHQSTFLAAALHTEALAGGDSRVGSQPSEYIDMQAHLQLPGTQQSACCPAEEAALLCMAPGQHLQRRQHPHDGSPPQQTLLAQPAAPPVQQLDARPPERQQNGAAPPAAAADADATPAASTGSPSLSPELERACTQAAQQVLQNLPAAFEKADTGCSASMLRPLRRLLLAGQGGDTLRDIVARWAGYSLAQQQEVFSTAVLVAGTANWQDLEDQLKLALELSS
ncbi:hypothetical protein ABPG77_010332 [Micractinium sp. CCAP 211/92]